jgi:hypothetical protein
MTTPREFDRLMEAFLDEGPTVLPDRVQAAIRDDVEGISVRADRGSWRNSPMLRTMIAATVVAAVLLGGFAIYSALNLTPDVGPPDDSAVPLPSDGATTGLPPELQYSWVGPPKSPPGVSGTSDRGDISYENELWRFEIAPGTDFWSSPTITADGDLRLTTGVEGLCAVGDEGTYPWSLERDGTILTIEPGTDDCAARAAAMPGGYQRAACRTLNAYCLGELGAGTYLSHVFEPRPGARALFRHGAMSYTVPAGWASYEDGVDTYGLTPLDQYASFDGSCYACEGGNDLVTVLSNPGAATQDCGEDGNVPGIGFTAQDLVDWMAGHPGLVTSASESSRIGGWPALSVTIQAREDWTGTCDPENPFLAVPVFYRLDGYHWALNVGERYHVTLVDIGDGETVAVVVDSADEEGFEAFVEDARPVIASMEFPPR